MNPDAGRPRIMPPVAQKSGPRMPPMRPRQITFSQNANKGALRGSGMRKDRTTIRTHCCADDGNACPKSRYTLAAETPGPTRPTSLGNASSSTVLAPKFLPATQPF
eukprot:2795729-Pyramimonas_sp.AAC.1